MVSAAFANRERVIKRSRALGHCVCNPQQPCPCDLLREQNICECAGEKRPVPSGEIHLTRMVRHPGCASKISQADLARALSDLPDVDDARIVVGRSACDDAGVIMLSQDQATVLTVDVFAPVVDDPYTFGQIAAANSLSDIYAMGAVPQCALSIIGFPADDLPIEVMHELLRGGIDKMREAGISVLGGHSINDKELKLGFAVLGTSGPGAFVRNCGARPGDALVLTKPLGTGIVTFAAQCGLPVASELAEATRSMKALNKHAGSLLASFDAHAATDITGFGLLGHAAGLAKDGDRESSVALVIDFDRLPVLPGVAELARQEVLPGAVLRNREGIRQELLDISALALPQQEIIFGPETSGGLLVALPQDRAARFVDELRSGGCAAAAIVGHVVESSHGPRLRVETRCADEFRTRKLSARKGALEEPAPSPAPSGGCCCAPTKHEDAAATPVELPATKARTEPRHRLPNLPLSVTTAFGSYMDAVTSPAALDAKTTVLLRLALSVATKCEPCVRTSVEAAKEAGASDQEIAEAAALATAFGGAPVTMFYNSLVQA
jgi:selenide, water dikinase